MPAVTTMDKDAECGLHTHYHQAIYVGPAEVHTQILFDVKAETFIIQRTMSRQTPTLRIWHPGAK